MLKKFLRNRKGTAEVIGSVLFIIIILFFFSNVYLWHDQATSQMNTLISNKMNSPVRLVVDGSSLIVTNGGGVDVYLSRLWILTVDNHIYADLEPLNIYIAKGSQKTISFGSTQTNPDGSINATYNVGNSILVRYSLPSGSIRFQILTTLGNTAACTYPDSGSSGGGGSGGTDEIGSVIIADFETFTYYNISEIGNTGNYNFDFTTGENGYLVNSDPNGADRNYVLFSVVLTNRNQETIHLNPNSQLFFVRIFNPTSVGYLSIYVVKVTTSGNIGTISQPSPSIDLPTNVPTTVYFACGAPMTSATFAETNPGNEATCSLNLALLGTIGSVNEPYGQNIPFVSIFINN